jgi:hypothetical protein
MAMAAQALDAGGQQLPLNDRWTAAVRRARYEAPRCAGCREREARYGFRTEGDDPVSERPRTLCFDCFRVELGRRQAIQTRLAGGWNAQQAALPLEHTLEALRRRRRRAQIAARHTIDAR